MRMLAGNGLAPEIHRRFWDMPPRALDFPVFAGAMGTIVPLAAGRPPIAEPIYSGVAITGGSVPGRRICAQVRGGAGHALAVFRGTAFVVHYILMGVAGIIVSWAMLKSAVFGRATALAGLLQGTLMLVPSTAGTVGVAFALASLVPFVVWFVLVAWRLFALAKGSTATAESGGSL